MIRTLLHDPKTGETRRGDESLLSVWAQNPDMWVWADFSNEDPERERTCFLEKFDLHPLAVADAQRDRHPPKLELFENCFFLLMHGLDASTTDIDYKSIPITFFVGDRFLVTRRKAESVSIDKSWAAAEGGEIAITRGPAYITYRIVRLITDRYTNLVEGLERGIDEMEDEMFQNPRDALLEELIAYGRNLKRLQRVFNYHQSLFVRLSRKDQPFIGKQERHEFIDIYEHTERLASLTTLFKELTDDLMNGYISVNSHRLNQIMKVLTIVTVLFLPLALLVGIYGMNFEYIPELKFANGYFVLLSIMGLIVAGLLLFFRRIRWI